MTDISKVNIDRIDGLNEELNQLSTELNSQILKISQPGDICYSLRTEKTGWLLCNGQAVSRTIYADLFAVIGTKFGSGNGSTTFNVPNCSGKFLQMDTSKTLGASVAAGLPNITGTLKYQYAHSVSSASGCFSDVNGGNVGAIGSPGATNNNGFSFSASKSNSIYGRSSTVQPPAIIVNYFIKY